ncbi:hypothetical protein C7S17_7284 [Burkholderia thailandensis]|nr:hypothetical protein [Burkholderia thailandensis]
MLTERSTMLASPACMACPTDLLNSCFPFDSLVIFFSCLYRKS